MVLNGLGGSVPILLLAQPIGLASHDAHHGVRKTMIHRSIGLFSIADRFNPIHHLNYAVIVRTNRIKHRGIGNMNDLGSLASRRNQRNRAIDRPSIIRLNFLPSAFLGHNKQGCTLASVVLDCAIPSLNPRETAIAVAEGSLIRRERLWDTWPLPWRCPDFPGHPARRKYPHWPQRFPDSSRQSTGGRDRSRDLATDQKCRRRIPCKGETPDKREDRRDGKACRAASASSLCPLHAASTCAHSSSVSTPCSCPSAFRGKYRRPWARSASVPD